MKNKKSKITSILSKDIYKKIVTLTAILVPFSIIAALFYYGHLTFWYDNARDLNSAWNNLQKPTLIGPTSGIPGIFYGPYWIWLLSFGLLISKDPLVVAFITATLPYYILLPLIWFRFSKFLGLHAVIIGWLLLMLSTGITYAAQLWNPYPAPLITVAILYLLIVINFKLVSKKNILKFVLLGFLLGLLINFHISFGIAFLFGVMIYLLWNLVSLFIKKKMWNDVKTVAMLLACIILGFFIAFIPTLLFEFRHGFNQIETLVHTFTRFGDVVEVTGLSNPEILAKFGATLSSLLHMPVNAAIIVIVVMIALFIWLLFSNKITLREYDKKIIALIISIFTGIAAIYFTARNPVWEYHFIGVDIFFLLLVTYLLAKLKHARILFSAWIIYVAFTTLTTTISEYGKTYSGFYSQKDIVETIVRDAGPQPYAAARYTNATYSHENTYLFRWIENKDVPNDPNLTPPLDITYLIVPIQRDPKVDDFINYRTPHAKFRTEKTWDIGNNYRVLKRVKI